MKGCFELFPQALQVSADGQRRSCLIKQTSASGECIEKELWFLYPADLPMPEDADCDAYLIAALLPAMQLNADITVHGSVSRELLANLTELQLVWRKWRPELYFSVAIHVERIRGSEGRVAGAVVAFSGGADAQFSTYRHMTRQAGYSTQVLLAGVLVHGFDIPLADIQGFAGAERMAAEVLDDLGISLLPVKTNIRGLWNINWNYYFAAAVASVLCGLDRYAGAGLIGSSEPYDALITPLGSHPITDPLLSSGAFKIIHDGAGFSRSEKIKTISEWSLGVKNLRVCWAGGEHDRNCGVCEKCVRTQLNFIVAGVLNPLCFNTPLETSSFKSIVISSEGARAEWEQIRNEIIKSSIGVQWLPLVERVLKRKASPRFGLLLPAGSQRRLWAKSLVERYRQ